MTQGSAGEQEASDGGEDGDILEPSPRTTPGKVGA